MTTKIEWTNETWNPITGCSHASEGCQNCYAEKMHKRLTAMGQKKYSKPFNQVVFHKNCLACEVKGKNKMIFVNSMSDTFHRQIMDKEIQMILDECEFNNLNYFQILTKRAERLPDFVIKEWERKSRGLYFLEKNIKSSRKLWRKNNEF